MLSTIFARQGRHFNSARIFKNYTTKVNLESHNVASSESHYIKGLREEWLQGKPFKSLPGPTRYQMLRGFMKNGEFHGKPFDKVIQVCRERYGDIYLLPGMFGQNTSLLTFNPDDYEKIFRTEGQYPERPGLEIMYDYRTQRKDDLYANGNLGASGRGLEWWKYRNIVNPVLMQPKNAALYIGPTQKLNDDFIERIRQIRDPSSLEVPENFLSEILRLAFESVTVIALDADLGLVRNNVVLPEAQELFDNLQCFSRALYDLGVKPSIYRYVKTPTYKRFENSMDIVTNICRKFVDEALRRIEERGDLEGEGKSVLEKLIKIDRKVAVVTAVDLLFAGVETTSSIISSILLCLATNPEKQLKLREEILQTVGKTGKFTMGNMKNLPYLRACIKESFRVYPLIFGNMRTSGADLCLSGYQIPKGTHVFLASNMLLQDECYFARPKEFIPERWLRSSSDSKDSEAVSLMTHNPFIFFPFGFGPRSCAGKRVVNIQVEIIVANIVRNLEVEYNYPTENAFAHYFTNTCIIPLKFKFTDLK